MASYICDYAKISPVNLEMIIQRAFPRATIYWSDINENCFKIHVFELGYFLDELEDIIAEYLWVEE